MKFQFRSILAALALAFWGLAHAFAFLPPSDTLHGVTLRIEGFEDKSTHQGLNVTKVPTDKVLEVKVSLVNTRKEAVAGDVRVWFNDDWKLAGTDAHGLSGNTGFQPATSKSESETRVPTGTAALPLRAAPGASASATLTATARPSVVGGALYPVHAKVTLSLDGETFTLHPIAVFETVKPALPPAPKAATTAKPAVKSQSVKPIPALSEEEWKAQEDKAKKAVRAEIGQKSPSATATNGVLHVRGAAFGTAVLPGRQGLFDGIFAFADSAGASSSDLLFKGFVAEIDGVRVGVPGGLSVVRVSNKRKAPSGKDRVSYEITHHVALPNGTVIPVRAIVRREGPALTIAWDMPGVKRDKRGSPRFTRLGIGPANKPVFRAYAGFGNVIQNPGAFNLGSGGFELSTRHVGADYKGGLSLLQACDVFPDRLTHAPDTRRFALETHHDAKFLFIPSATGAFAAARAYSDINGFRAAPGVAALLGRQCLDQWSGDYAGTAHGLQRAARYGLTDTIFVKHAWQRWGYDYRLPEIYPPAASRNQWGSGTKQHETDLPGFLAIRKAALRAGILFCPHDNYIDFYPDASGFSYDHIVFDEHGKPVKHWYNNGRTAQSFRWLPHAFAPRLRENAKLMRDGFAPDSLFIDVFTAVTPFDYYDRHGNFYLRTRTIREWAGAFDTARSILKPGAPMLSEAGLDALIGSLDGGQSDHFPASRWNMTFDAAERTPWHDMASHGRFVLFAGGLANRYGALRWDYVQQPGHGYASDDYLSNTVLGGRNPMSNGPFTHDAVLTYWLVHDVCASLAKATFETHAFGANVHQQHTTFSNGGKVWVNRGEENWEPKLGERLAPKLVGGRGGNGGFGDVGVVGKGVGGQSVVLPEYGFYVETPEARAGVVHLNGRRVAFAISPDVFFVDARSAQALDAKAAGGTAKAAEKTVPRELADFGPLATDGTFRLLLSVKGAWQIIPVVGSGPFRAELRLAALDASGRKVKAVKVLHELEGVKVKGQAAAPQWKQVGGVLHLSADAKAFGYEIVLE